MVERYPEQVHDIYHISIQRIEEKDFDAMENQVSYPPSSFPRAHHKLYGNVRALGVMFVLY